MRIAVCIKQIPANDTVEIDPVTHRLIRIDTEMTVNPADLNALTEAVHLKQQTGAQVDVYTMGADGAKAALYTALAIGADEAYLVTDRAFAGGDTLGTAKVLAAAMQSVAQYDLVICGALASDGATGQVGAMLAEILKIPSVTEVKKIGETADTSVTVYKAWKGQLAQLRMSLPGLLTVSLGANKPILPTLRNQMKAKKKTIHSITNEELALNPEEIGLQGAKSIVTDTYLREASGKQSMMLSGTAEEIADQIVELMQKVGE
ncbi:MAG: electron transfer flavoprotein subunit beta/FixA family protein [Clostridia bacterium]|nr:electron transfer flavoprotein subunit beta/FixA family protein [Clostridia bacterium]